MRVFITCVWCSRRFEATRDTVKLIGTEQEPKYCGKLCRKASDRSKPLAKSCPSCHGPRYRGDQHGMCSGCNSVAYLACWSKKLRYVTEPAAVQHEDGEWLLPYRCEVCGDWHLTSRKDGVSESWVNSARAVGAYLASVGWDFRNAAWRKKEIREALG